MSSYLLLIAMLLGVLIFSGMIAIVYKSWTREAKEAELGKISLDELREDLSRFKTELDKVKDERTLTEKKVTDLKQRLDSTIQERSTDRVAYQSLFDKFETQIQTTEAELKKKVEQIKQLEQGETTTPVPKPQGPTPIIPPAPPEKDRTKASDPPQKQHN